MSTSAAIGGELPEKPASRTRRGAWRYCEGDFGIEVHDDHETCRLGLLRSKRESPQL